MSDPTERAQDRHQAHSTLLAARDTRHGRSLGCGMGKLAVILLVAGVVVALIGLVRIRYERRRDD